MTRLLLTTTFGPYGVVNRYNKKDDELLMDYLASRLTREPKPGLFTLSSYLPTTGLHVIGANLPVESKVIENVSEKEFTEEVKKGYDYIGISFVYKGYTKVLKMIAIIRKYAPQTKIILGGYGTDIPEIEKMGADYVCQSEGLSFMRNLLGFSSGSYVSNPEITPEITLKVLQGYDLIEKPRMGVITSGFGCPRACEFCCTSKKFDHKHLPFLENGEQIYKAMLYFAKHAATKVDNFLIYEEDLLMYKTRVKELGELIRNDKENTFTYGCFASVKSLSNWDLEELASQGLGHVWIGVESVNLLYKKREGKDIKEIFDNLHSLGITTTGSIIFGLDHHNHEELKKEIDFLISLRPTTNQIAHLMPGISTDVFKRLSAEKKLLPFTPKDTDLYSEVIKHPAFEYGEIHTAIFEGYERIYNFLGPSIFRTLDTWLTGYKNLKISPNEALRRRALKYAKQIKGIVPVFLNTSEFLPNDDIRRKVSFVLDEIKSEFGEFDAEQTRKGEMIGEIFQLEDAKRRNNNIQPIEPPVMITEYNEKTYERLSKFFN